MFSKKSLPANTFIPTPARTMAISQLCLSFTVLLFILGYPFTGHHYVLKSRLLVFDSVIQSNLFKTLPLEEQNLLLKERNSIKARMSYPFMTKIASSINKFATTAGFKQAWIALSIVIALLILLKVEGAALAAWVLPLLAIAYALDNYLEEGKQFPSQEEKLFPSESLLIDKYLGQKLSGNIFNQREELLHGWHLYLIDEFIMENPATDPLLFKEQVARGEFAFNLKRASLISQDPIRKHPREKESPLLLNLYVFWNIFFAWFVNRSKWKLA